MSLGFRWVARSMCAVAVLSALALSGCGDDDYGIDGASTPHDLSVNQDLTTPPPGDGGGTD